ncbi:MAG: hypothetical protein IT381_29065 [Deltaproteobacteria bacterium]|nr:hypothetical protein [Deltaproteobacteria bacterium]
MSPSLAGRRSALVAAAIAAVAAPALAYLMIQLPLFTPHVLSLYAVCVAALVAFAAPAGTWLGPRVVAASDASG